MLTKKFKMHLPIGIIDLKKPEERFGNVEEDYHARFRRVCGNECEDRIHVVAE